jgi:hypothetical protein
MSSIVAITDFAQAGYEDLPEFRRAQSRDHRVDAMLLDGKCNAQRGEACSKEIKGLQLLNC